MNLSIHFYSVGKLPIRMIHVRIVIYLTTHRQKVYVFSDTVVCAFSEGVFGKILASIRYTGVA